MDATATGLIADAWLSGLLKRSAFRLSHELHIDAALAARLAQAPLFVTAKASAIDVKSIAHLQDAGFRVVDTALTFDAEGLSGGPEAASRQGHVIRFAQPDDRAGVVALAGRAFRFSRFHLDPVLPNTIADRIKAAWADNFFNGLRGDAMVVAEDERGIVGFLQLLGLDVGGLVIDLIAVAPEATRHGIASAMIAFAWRSESVAGRLSLRVGTQAANIGSCRLYESLGFRLREAVVVLHHHGSGGSYPAEGVA
jgi:ribosomal protein S18 acetylase RimI-like enzyme